MNEESEKGEGKGRGYSSTMKVGMAYEMRKRIDYKNEMRKLKRQKNYAAK